MKRQLAEICRILLGLFTFFFLVGMFISVPLYWLAFYLGHGYPMSRLLYTNAIGILFGITVCFPLLLLETRHLKGDPYRFSPRLRAYFRLPEHVDVQQLLDHLHKSFQGWKVESQTRLEVIWNPSEEQDGLQTFYARNASRNRQRSIVINLLNGWHGFRGRRVEVLVETTAPIKLINGNGLNQVALQVLMDTLGWEKYRVAVDTEGKPQW